MRGCPQGYTLSLLLWNIFQNDLTMIIREADVSMYADDHQLFLSDQWIRAVKEKLVEDGIKMTKWYEENLLQVNIKKYQSMILGQKKNFDDMNMHIGGIEIEQSKQMKLLGVNIDSDLNFGNHIRKLCIRTSQQIGVLTRLRILYLPCCQIQGSYFTSSHVLQHYLVFL